jgi:PEP-CTERM motif
MRRLLFSLSAIVVSLALATPCVRAAQIALDPAVALTVFSTNQNDSYSLGRGVWFQASQDLNVTGAGFFNGFGEGDGFTLTLWTADSTGTNLHVSALGSFGVNPAITDDYEDGVFGSALSLTAGNYYYLEVTSSAVFDRNYYYNWNGPGVAIAGLGTILDGGSSGDLSNTVAPALRLDATPATSPVPEPATFALISVGLIGLGMARRRR